MKNLIPIIAISLLAGCNSITTAVKNMKDKAVGIQSVIDGVDITMTEAESASTTPRVKAGHMQHDYFGIPIQSGQPIRIIRRTYGLFFGNVLSETSIEIYSTNRDLKDSRNPIARIK